MDTELWLVISQVAATFIGLVFVGFSIYLSGIQTAKEKTLAELDLDEKSSSIAPSVALSNLGFFVMPFLASLYMGEKAFRSERLWSFIVLGTLTLAGIVTVLLQNRLLLHTITKTSAKYLRIRLRAGLPILVLVMLVTLLLLIWVANPLTKWTASPFWLEVVTVLSLMLGLVLGLGDLVALDTSQVMFEKSQRAKKIVRTYLGQLERKLRKLNDECAKIEHRVRDETFQAILELYEAGELDTEGQVQTGTNVRQRLVEAEMRIKGTLQNIQSALDSTQGRGSLRAFLDDDSYVSASEVAELTKHRLLLQSDLTTVEKELEYRNGRIQWAIDKFGARLPHKG